MIDTKGNKFLGKTIFFVILLLNFSLVIYSQEIKNNSFTKVLKNDKFLSKISNETSVENFWISPEIETGRGYQPKHFRFMRYNSNFDKRTSSPYRRNYAFERPRYPELVYPIHRPHYRVVKNSNNYGSRNSFLEQPKYNEFPARGQIAMDRFAPGEAYSATLYKLKKEKQNGYNYSPPKMPLNDKTQTTVVTPLIIMPTTMSPLNFGPFQPPKLVSMSNENTNDYIPPSPKDLYSFPPLINATYLPPSGSLDVVKNKDPQTSYLPPAAGPTEYLPPQMDSVDQSKEIQDNLHDHSNDNTHDHIMNYGQPPTDMMQDDTSMFAHSHNNPPQSMSPMEMMAYPSDVMEHGDENHHDIIYDHHDYSYHDFHHDDHDMTPPPTSTMPPPPEPRVKKYSYYYLGRKLWYIPLYFTIWFISYVAWLITKSIARHKVNLPNHWQTRRKREIPYLKEIQKISKMTTFVMSQIEDFERKYMEMNSYK